MRYWYFYAASSRKHYDIQTKAIIIIIIIDELKNVNELLFCSLHAVASTTPVSHVQNSMVKSVSDYPDNTN
jgi:hypothetical protein